MRRRHLELLDAAPDPVSAARFDAERIAAALRRARRRDVAGKTAKIQAALRAEHLGQPAVVAGAYAVTVRAQVAILATFNSQIATMKEQVEAHFGRHPDAEIYLSQPGLGVLLGARVLAEFGDDKTRYADARARKNYAGTSPITRQSGKKKLVLARYVHNDRLLDALGLQAFAALRPSPGARAYYDLERARCGTAAARQPARRHPARLPQDRHQVRRRHRVGTPPTRSTNCRLTTKLMGCLSAYEPSTGH